MSSVNYIIACLISPSEVRIIDDKPLSVYFIFFIITYIFYSFMDFLLSNLLYLRIIHLLCIDSIISEELLQVNANLVVLRYFSIKLFINCCAFFVILSASSTNNYLVLRIF